MKIVFGLYKSTTEMKKNSKRKDRETDSIKLKPYLTAEGFSLP